MVGRLSSQKSKQQYNDRLRDSSKTRGLKPHECFWWPYHVYTSGDGELLIEVAKTCCEGWRHHNDIDAAMFLDSIDEQVNALGTDLIHSFRRHYSGSYGRTPIRPVNMLRWDFLKVEQLPAYRKIGEHFFPGADWDDGVARYKRLLLLYPQGILAAWLGDRIVAYASLWPVTRAFKETFLAGEGRDEDLTEDALLPPPITPDSSWFLTSVAIQTNNVLLRRKLRAHLDHFIRGGRDMPYREQVFAEAVTPQGRKYLEKLGFKFTFETNPDRCRLAGQWEN